MTVEQPQNPFRDDIASLSPRTRVSRREIIVTSLAAGFATAAGPVSAQAITTDTNGLTAGEVQIPAAGGRIPAYRAMPAQGTTFPVVLVVQEIFGVHEHIKDICRRLAKIGYLAVAPEMFARQGDVSKITDIQQLVSQVVSKVPDDQVMKDLDAAVAWAKANKGDTNRLAMTGFCWGGRAVWMYAAHNPSLKAGAAWYGRLVGDATPMTPKQPVDIAPQIKAPILGLYGGKDTGIPLDSIEKMRKALPPGSKSKIVVFPEAQHGFNADYRPSYGGRDAKEAWAGMLSWFKANGAAPNAA